jgi:hypothetical protein
MSFFLDPPTFSEVTPNKIAKGIKVSGKNTLTETVSEGWRFAIADKPVDARVDGKKIFCVRVESLDNTVFMIGFTPLETFNSSEQTYFGLNNFDGVGLAAYSGVLFCSFEIQQKIIDGKISGTAQEIIVILDVSYDGATKEIRFLCDGHESESSDVSEFLKGDLMFPAVVFSD